MQPVGRFLRAESTSLLNDSNRTDSQILDIEGTFDPTNTRVLLESTRRGGFVVKTSEEGERELVRTTDAIELRDQVRRSAESFTRWQCWIMPIYFTVSIISLVLLTIKLVWLNNKQTSNEGIILRSFYYTVLSLYALSMVSAVWITIKNEWLEDSCQQLSGLAEGLQWLEKQFDEEAELLKAHGNVLSTESEEFSEGVTLLESIIPALDGLVTTPAAGYESAEPALTSTENDNGESVKDVSEINDSLKRIVELTEQSQFLSAYITAQPSTDLGLTRSQYESWQSKLVNSAKVKWQEKYPTFESLVGAGASINPDALLDYTSYRLALKPFLNSDLIAEGSGGLIDGDEFKSEVNF